VRFLKAEFRILGRNRLSGTEKNEYAMVVKQQRRVKEVVRVEVVGSQVGSLSAGVEPTGAVIQFTGGTL
jgi:hypothetical protein